MSKLKTPTGVAGWNRFHQRANSSSCSRAQASNTTSSQQRDQPGPGPARAWRLLAGRSGHKEARACCVTLWRQASW